MSEDIVRDQCTRCAIKHLGQAKILMDESELGYPHHVWYALGHMAEAEILEVQPEDAAAIREARILIQDNFDKPRSRWGYVYFDELMTYVAKGGLLPEAEGL